MTQKAWISSFRTARVNARRAAAPMRRQHAREAWARGMTMLKQIHTELAPEFAKLEKARQALIELGR